MPRSSRRPGGLVRIEDPLLLMPGRDGVAMKFVTTRGTTDIAIPFAELGAVIEFLVKAAAEAGEGITPPPRPYSPIPTQGVGFAAGPDASETLLVVGLTGFQLAFSIPSSDLAGFADALARTARTLSADRPQ